MTLPRRRPIARISRLNAFAIDPRAAAQHPRDPKNGRAVNNSSMRRVSARSLSSAGFGVPADRQRLVLAVEHRSPVWDAQLSGPLG